MGVRAYLAEDLSQFVEGYVELTKLKALKGLHNLQFLKDSFNSLSKYINKLVIGSEKIFSQEFGNSATVSIKLSCLSWSRLAGNFLQRKLSQLVCGRLDYPGLG